METHRQLSANVYVVIVNYNGWRHSIECLASLLNLSHPNFRLIVCDNHSNDHSLEELRCFVKAKLPKPQPIRKWFPCDGYEAMRIESVESYGRGLSRRQDTTGPRSITLIRTTANLGFGAGNNIGIRYALSVNDTNYVWLLNNDTVVEPQTLSAMIKRMIAVPEAGICGSTILNYEDPRKIQALGGARYLKWAGIGAQIGANGRWPFCVQAEPIENAMSYVAGASMLISRQFFETVGLMAESYFLYFEEIDWMRRSAGRFKLAYAPDSIVYHKQGSAIGSSRTDRPRSPGAFYWLTRSRLKFTAKYHPEALASVSLYSLINCMQWAFLHRNPRILMSGIKAFSPVGSNAMQNR
jgi:GT2 family glycosyltransferase